MVDKRTSGCLLIFLGGSYEPRGLDQEGHKI